MNVPISEEPLGNNADDIWHRHESEIRRLYQTKGLEEVMKFMESKPGFPKLKPKTLIEKLGNDGIRKTVKNEEWAKIYQHIARYRLKDPTPVRGGNRVGNGVEKTDGKKGDKRWKKMIKDTEVMLGDKKFKWEQVWKNLRRAGAIVDLQPDPPSPLPSDILVQTPGSEPSPQSPHSPFNTSRPRDGSITTIQSQELSLVSEHSTLQNSTTYLHGQQGIIQQSRLQTPSSNNPFPLTCLALSDCVKAQMMLHLPLLPIWNFSNAVLQISKLDLPFHNAAWDPWYDVAISTAANTKLTVKPALFSGTGVLNNSVFHLTDLLSSLIITQSSAALAIFSVQQKASIAIVVAIYLLSNNLISIDDMNMSGHKGFFETLDSIFAEIPAGHLEALLQSRLATVRGAFEALLKIAGRLKQRVAFKSLVDIGTKSRWLENSRYGHGLLCFAVCMDLDDVVKQLVEIGCRPETYVHQEGSTSAIIEALKRQNIHCAQLLLKKCDVNKRFRMHGSGFPCATSFTLFIYYASRERLDEMRIGQGIKLFLDAGADINSLLTRHVTLRFHDPEIWAWRYDIVWSVPDYLFCFHPRLFCVFIPNWNLARDSHPTRAGVLTSLTLGRNALHEYCTRLEQVVDRAYLDRYLVEVLTEQLTGVVPWPYNPSSEVDLQTVAALVDFGVSMDDVLSRAPCLLVNYMEEKSNCDLEVTRYLLENGATVDNRALQTAVRLGDTGLLALLIRHTPNIWQQGVHIAVEAATRSNFEAINMLLDAGVDVNAEFPRNGSRKQQDQAVSLLCQIVESWTSSFEDLRSMIDLLVQRGAHFRLSAMRPRLSDLLERVLHSRNLAYEKGVQKKMAQYIIDAGCDLSDPPARLLEACGYLDRTQAFDGHLQRMEIFESMFRRGAALRPGAPLAAWISMGGGAELVYEMLSCGVDIDAYSRHQQGMKTALQAAAALCNLELVVLLIQNGADVNAPARGRCGRTALQAICQFDSQSPAEKAQQIEIINLLVAHDANINAAPARHDGGTALQCAVMCGNLEVVMLLLSCDPQADINAPACQFSSFSSFPVGKALDFAALCGRLDLAKLLLDNGGLSSSPGDTGYDGAIKSAEESGFSVVADLIRQHSAAISSSSTTRPNASQPHRDWLEYGYDDYSDGYTTYDEDNLWKYDSWEYYDSEYASSSEEQDSMAQVQFQPDPVVHPGPTHAAPGEVEDDNSLNFGMGFDNLGDDMGSIYDLGCDASTSHIDTAASGSGFG